MLDLAIKVTFRANLKVIILYDLIFYYLNIKIHKKLFLTDESINKMFKSPA